VKVYTRTGDDGTTGLFYGGRVRKDSPRPVAYGSVDELQAALGVVRAQVDQDHPLAALLVDLERDLYIVMSELATLPENRSKLKPEKTMVTDGMVERLEQAIDRHASLFEAPAEFVIPGGSVVSAHLDLARTVARRAERVCLAVAEEGSAVLRYLNRLSDLLWVLARWQDGDNLPARS
jgi:cob(I)alamin adenosyltransferase